ncbi:MAG: helix-hairpin-helix domain-containing protein [Bacteroidetes bacterium]|nr:helix-hairpin-helix domain-containing protein [Bacteroidota bacterium]
MKSFFRKYVSYTNQEKRGIWIALLIVISIATIYFFSDYVSSSSDPTLIDTSFQSEINSLKRTKELVDEQEAATPTDSTSIEGANNNYFRFNPNHLSKEEWRKLGVSERIVNNIQKYEQAGGSFKNKLDLKKIYGFSEQLYCKLEPYIYIENDSTLTAQRAGIPLDKKGSFKNLIDVNTADTNQLKSLKGIGSKLADRIIKYRNSLGGFYTKTQLKEVYGITSDTYNLIEPSITVSVEGLAKLNINTAEKDALAKHPYIKYKLANLLILYRTQHGNYHTKEDIKNIVVINDSIYSKLAPYISL